MQWIKNILYYITVIVLVAYILVLAIKPSAMMDIFGFKAYVVLSDSMDPVIKTNDVIVSKRTSQSDIQTGDIITFNVFIPELNDEGTVTHYVGKIEETDEGIVYYTKGTHQGEDIYDQWVDQDGNDRNVTYEDIEGEYLFKIPYLGYVIDFVSNTTVLFLLLVNGVAIYFIVKYIKKDQEE